MIERDELREQPIDTAPRSEEAIETHEPRWKRWLPFAILAAVVLLPLRGLLRAPGPPMEEGFMLVFPEEVLRGAIPNRDFLHLYARAACGCWPPSSRCSRRRCGRNAPSATCSNSH